MRFQIVLGLAFAGFALPAGSGQTTAAQHAASTVPVASPEAARPKTLSTRVVAYQIDAHLDTVKHTIVATETLRYRNLTGHPQKTFPFHLYLNAFQPQSTFITEERRDDPDYQWKPEHYGAISISHLEVTGMGDLTNQIHFIQPDDHNAADHTVMQIELPSSRSCRRGSGIQDRLQRAIARSPGANWIPARFLHGRPVVSEGWRVVERRVELPPVSQHDGILRGLRDVRCEGDAPSK